MVSDPSQTNILPHPSTIHSKKNNEFVPEIFDIEKKRFKRKNYRYFLTFQAFIFNVNYFRYKFIKLCTVYNTTATPLSTKYV